MSLKAQTNFIKGYYITTSHDTIHGLIEYRSEKRNYKFCVFRKESNSKAIWLYPNDILGFVVNDQDFYEQQSFRSTKGEELIGFFKVIVRGKLSLLRYQSRDFAKNDQGEIFEISKRSDVSNGKVRQDYSGIGLLKVLMEDCSETSGSFIENEYKVTSSFVGIFKKYNSCVGSSVSESEKIRIKPHVNLGVQLSPTATSLNLSATLEKAKFETELSFSVGGSASIFIPKMNEKIRLLLEATYGKYSQYSYFSSANKNNDVFIDYSYLRVPVLIRYNFNRLFFDLGIQNQFILNQDLSWRVESIFQDTVYTSKEEITPFSNWTGGFVAGLGIKQKISDYTLMSSFRFSRTQDSSHPNNPVFQTAEIIVCIQLK